MLLLPAFLISCIMERRFLRRHWSHVETRTLGRQVWMAHCISYGLLYLVAGYCFYQVAYE